MEVKDKIIIAEEFTDTPGARYRDDGPFSGQEFLEDILLPKFNKAIKEQYILLVDLDMVWGYPSSFVSGSFGELSMKVGANLVLKHLQFKSDKNPIRIDKVINEIKNPSPPKK